MEPSRIDLTPLRSALALLHGALGYWSAEPPDSGLKPHLRSAVIQSFEFSYELSVKALRRVLIERALSGERLVDVSFNDLLRLGADAGLLDDPLAWRRWREMRNSTSHTYDEAKAQAVALACAAFAADADALLSRLEAASAP
ncbi:MAG: HI0074 family nucleotidyltransferase substrate-binding subunit [Hydrogenophaga sp.]|nr:HI0074 family nucleotidyltransferase substrate-binding subunit [Hydrogenophaga sp.]